MLADPPPLGIDDLERLRGEGALVLDCRAPEAFSAHIPGAVHITGAEITRRADEIPRDRPVAAICGSGFRSSVAASVLKARGRREVYNVLGGMTGWEAEGLETTT